MVSRKKKPRSVEDRISHLPDHLISEILTRLSTKDAVRTSVLSTRWRNLWQLVPILDLDSRSEFRLFSEFVSFAGRFFDFHKDSCVQKLRLTTYDPDDKSYLTSWIDFVTRRRIQHLEINVVSCYYSFGDIPLSLYTCDTLVHLQLYRLTMVNVGCVSLPCVKILHLKYNHYPNEAILEKLISGSPVLEDLTIIRSSTENAKVLQVRSKTLKRIHVNEFVHVVIDAPLLQCLKTNLHLTKNITITNSGFPAKVDIDFGGAHDVGDPNGVSKRKVIRDILTDISRVRELVISLYFWKDIFPSFAPGPLLHFSYLSRLTATFCDSDLWMLPNLLKSCPKLESLILRLSANRLYIRGTKNNEPKFTFHTVVIPCVVSSLKFVELKSPIVGYEGEMELVRYFLKNSTILEKMSVTFSGYLRRKRVKATDAIFKELLAMPRSSSACQLLVV
ncbi:PREDICTED: F-box/FBD/LRR-repeat protein At5g53840-like [Camelina sativa]|uniref:F-box/FBD/LRR-repeat protein At5g53840-like n=1 Tax=Camelina sativa TaxID=90675 RepID=A0ABM0XF98_CAMSA|nr:PREDICTED: F-box/FBD/LRR-repeat protein At5g53840-like [Camelina sativa]